MRRALSLPLAAALLLPLSLAAGRGPAAPAPSQERPGAPPRFSAAEPIRGRVVDAAGAPLANARVWQSGFDEWRDGAWQVVSFSGLPRVVRTDADGRFELSSRTGVRSDLDVDLEGYAPAFVQSLAPGAQPRVVLHQGATVSGSVLQVGPDGARPIELAAVALERPNPRGLWFRSERRTGAQGGFAFDAFLAPDEVDAGWELVVNGARYRLDARPGEALEDLLVEVRIARGGR